MGRKPRIVMLASVETSQFIGGMLLNPRWKESLAPYDVDIRVIDPTTITREALDAELALADGIYLTGGNTNVPTYHYGQEPINQSAYKTNGTVQVRYHENRFQASRHMMRYALEHKIPILGVCLGAQEMNVALGGRLQQKLEGHMTPHPHSQWDAPVHLMWRNEKGMLRDVFQHAVTAQNSVHNLGMLIEDLAPGLRIEALDGDWNVVEAFSLPGHPFFVGVQFHVESSRYVPENEALTRFFVNKVRAKAYERADVSVAQKWICSKLCPETGRWELGA